jgi:hypothetical protein
MQFPATKERFVAIASRLRFRIRHEGPKNQRGLELNRTHQILVYGDGVNLMVKTEIP